jgi:hypothetical protein
MRSLILGLAFATPALAQFGLYSTNFNEPLYANGPLLGQDGWVITGTSIVNPLAVSNNPANGLVALTTTGQDANRPFTPAVTSDSIWVSADVTVSAAQATGDYFLHFSDGGSTIFNARVWAKSGTTGYVLALATSSGTPAAGAYGLTELAYGTTYRIVARYDFVAGAANDTGALFVNPVNPFGIGDTPYVNATTLGTDATTMSAVCLRQGTASAAATLTIDNINVSATVPAPATLALLAMGGIVATRRRR